MPFAWRVDRAQLKQKRVQKSLKQMAEGRARKKKEQEAAMAQQVRTQ